MKKNSMPALWKPFTPFLHRFRYLFLTILMIGVVSGVSLYRAYGASYTWTGGGDGTTWNSAANWGGSGYPSAAADTATINSTASNITIPANLNIAGITTGGTYSGTLTQGGAMTLGATGLRLGAGTLTMNGAALTISSAGSFSMTGGTWNMSSSVITLNQFNWTYTAGTINPDTSTVIFIGNVTVTGSHTLNNVTVTVPAGGYATTIASGTTLTVTGTLTLSGTSQLFGPGIIDAKGNVTVSGSFAGYTGNIRINGAGDQTFTGGGASACVPNITINKPSGTLTLVGTICVTAGNWTYIAGTIDPGTSTVNFSYNMTVTGSHTLNNVTVTVPAGSYGTTIASGTTLTVTGTLTLAGTSSLNGPGIVSAQGNVTVTGSFQGGNVPIRYTGTANQTYTYTSGTHPSGAITIDKPSGTVTLNSSSIGWNSNAVTLASTNAGTLDQNGKTLTVSSLTVAGGTLTQSGTTTITTLNIQSTGTYTQTSGSLTVSAFSMSGAGSTFNMSGTTTSTGNWTYTAGTINPGTSTIVFRNNGADSACTNPSAYIISGTQIFNNVTFYFQSCGYTTIASGTTITASGTLSVTNGTGTINTGTIVALGDVSYSGSSGGTATLRITGAGNQTFSSSSGSITSLVINKPSGILSLSGTITTSTATNAEADWTYISGTVDPGTSTVVFYNSNTDSGCFRAQDISGSHALNNVTFNWGYCGQTNITSGTTLTVNGNLVIFHSNTTLGTLNTGTLAVQGNVSWTGTGGGTAKLQFIGSNNQTFTYVNGTFINGNITINKPSGKVTLLSNANWNSGAQSLTITSGTLDMNGRSLSLGTGGLTIGAAGTLLSKGSTGTLTLAGNVSNSGNVIMQGNNTCGGSDVLTIASSAAVNRTWSGTGKVLISDTSLSRQTGTFTVYNSTNGGNNSGITFNTNCPSYGVGVNDGTLMINGGVMGIQ